MPRAGGPSGRWRERAGATAIGVASASILLAPVLLIVWLVDPPLPGPVAAMLRVATWITGAVFAGFLVLAAPFVLWSAGLAVVLRRQERQQARLDARRAAERRAARGEDRA